MAYASSNIVRCVLHFKDTGFHIFLDFWLRVVSGVHLVFGGRSEIRSESKLVLLNWVRALNHVWGVLGQYLSGERHVTNFYLLYFDEILNPVFRIHKKNPLLKKIVLYPNVVATLGTCLSKSFHLLASYCLEIAIIAYLWKTLSYSIHIP